MEPVTIHKNQINGITSEKKLLAAIAMAKEAQHLINQGDNDGVEQLKAIDPAIIKLVGKPVQWNPKTKTKAEEEQQKQSQQEADSKAKEERTKLLIEAKKGDKAIKDRLLETAWNEAGFTIEKTYRYLIRREIDKKPDEQFEADREAIRQQVLDEINSVTL